MTREAQARQVSVDMERQIAAFMALEDKPGARVHCIFLRLYRQTTLHWLDSLRHDPSPEFAYAAICRFYRIYENHVVRHLTSPLEDIPRHWRNYHRLSRRLTMRSPISTHLLLVSLGTRAHPRHDLSAAISQAVQDLKEASGQDVDPDRLLTRLISEGSAAIFLTAALAYVEEYRQEQSGWRWLVLSCYSGALRLLRPVWITVLESWRRAAWKTARSQFSPKTAPRVHTG